MSSRVGSGQLGATAIGPAFRVCVAYLDEENSEVYVLRPGWRAAREVEGDVLGLGARRQDGLQGVRQLQHRRVRDPDQRRYRPGKKQGTLNYTGRPDRDIIPRAI